MFFIFIFKKSSLFLHFLPSLSVHLLKALSQGSTHQISIVDLLMPRSVLQRQRFHTQDEREMNTEDTGGDMGPWPGQPLPLWPLHCTGLGSERSWGGGAQIEVSHLCNNSYPSRPPRWPSTDWFSAAWLPQSKPSCYYWFLMRHRKSRRSVLRMSARIGSSGESMFRVTKTELLTISVKAFFSSPLFLHPGPFETSPDA